MYAVVYMHITRSKLTIMPVVATLIGFPHVFNIVEDCTYYKVFDMLYFSVPAGSPSRGGDVTVYV